MWLPAVATASQPAGLASRCRSSLLAAGSEQMLYGTCCKQGEPAAWPGASLQCSTSRFSAAGSGSINVLLGSHCLACMQLRCCLAGCMPHACRHAANTAHWLCQWLDVCSFRKSMLQLR